ncbi:MAG: ankyrin repeat domain-containing protein [Endozoicomonadaceae bacterium]|nr:ankyrin repeat domain-containing protein [Endozoicomonadaceae bacterium]
MPTFRTDKNPKTMANHQYNAQQSTQRIKEKTLNTKQNFFKKIKDIGFSLDLKKMTALINFLKNKSRSKSAKEKYVQKLNSEFNSMNFEDYEGRLNAVKLLNKGIDSSYKQQTEKWFQSNIKQMVNLFKFEKNQQEQEKFFKEDSVTNLLKNNVMATILTKQASDDTDISLMEFVVNNGKPDINKKNNKGDSLLMQACYNHDDDIVRVLLKAKDIDIHTTNKYGQTPFTEACATSQTKILELLKDVEGLDPNETDRFRQTGLMLACKKGHADTISTLLTIKGINLNRKDLRGDTALILAAREGQSKAVTELLKAEGIDVNSQNIFGHTALIIACQNHDINTAKKLLSFQGIDINVQNEQGDTALIIASQLGDQKMVDLLIEYKADVNIKNKLDKTATDIAVEQNFTNIVESISGKKQSKQKTDYM